MFADLALLDSLVQVVVALFGIAATYAAAQVSKKTGMDIEQTHITRIKDAVANVATKAMADGKTDIVEITSLSMSYLVEQLPQAMKAIKPTNKAVATIAAYQLETLLKKSF